MDIMIHLETIGFEPGCVILSISAAVFEPATEKQPHEFYVEINTSSAKNAGLSIKEEVFKWQYQQSEKYQNLIHRCITAGEPIYEAINDFNIWLKTIGPQEDKRIWANNNFYSFEILHAALNAIHFPSMWKIHQQFDSYPLLNSDQNRQTASPNISSFPHSTTFPFKHTTYQTHYMKKVYKYIVNAADRFTTLSN